ncbi:hypothetical protein XELAEV_18046241mg, partial [Xenopus laevis]
VSRRGGAALQEPPQAALSYTMRISFTFFLVAVISQGGAAGEQLQHLKVLGHPSLSMMVTVSGRGKTIKPEPGSRMPPPARSSARSTRTRPIRGYRVGPHITSGDLDGWDRKISRRGQKHVISRDYIIFSLEETKAGHRRKDLIVRIEDSSDSSDFLTVCGESRHVLSGGDRSFGAAFLPPLATQGALPSEAAPQLASLAERPLGSGEDGDTPQVLFKCNSEHQQKSMSCGTTLIYCKTNLYFPVYTTVIYRTPERAHSVIIIAPLLLLHLLTQLYRSPVVVPMQPAVPASLQQERTRARGVAAGTAHYEGREPGGRAELSISRGRGGAWMRDAGRRCRAVSQWGGAGPRSAEPMLLQLVHLQLRAGERAGGQRQRPGAVEPRTGTLREATSRGWGDRDREQHDWGTRELPIIPTAADWSFEWSTEPGIGDSGFSVKPCVCVLSLRISCLIWESRCSLIRQVPLIRGRSDSVTRFPKCRSQTDVASLMFYLQAYDGNASVSSACTPGFSADGYTALVSPNIMEGQKLLKGASPGSFRIICAESTIAFSLLEEPNFQFNNLNLGSNSYQDNSPGNRDMGPMNGAVVWKLSNECRQWRFFIVLVNLAAGPERQKQHGVINRHRNLRKEDFLSKKLKEGGFSFQETGGRRISFPKNWRKEDFLSKKLKEGGFSFQETGGRRISFPKNWRKKDFQKTGGRRISFPRNWRKEDLISKKLEEGGFPFQEKIELT